MALSTSTNYLPPNASPYSSTVTGFFSGTANLEIIGIPTSVASVHSSSEVHPSSTPGYAPAVIQPGTPPTTTSQTTISATTTPANSKAKTTDPGPIAGAAVGCFVAGAIIASLAWLFLFKRRGRKRFNGNDVYDTPPPHGSNGAYGKKATTVTISLPEDSAAAIVENNMQQPAEDKTITGDLSRLKNKIDGHIQYFYGSNPANDQLAVQALQQLLNGSPIPTTGLGALLSNPRSRPAVLRAALAWIMISRIDLQGDEKASLLPPAVAQIVHNLPQTKLDQNGKYIVARMLYNLEMQIGSLPHMPNPQVRIDWVTWKRS
jgi:hypothetical protein